MPRPDLNAIPQTNDTGYPAEYAEQICERWYRRFAPVSGLGDFGVSHIELKPGAWSAQKHQKYWHEDEDEFIVMLAGVAVLVDDSGHTPMRPDDCAAFPKNDGNGHVLINESGESCSYIVIGKPAASDCHYPDIDLHLEDGRDFRRKDNSGFDWG